MFECRNCKGHQAQVVYPNVPDRFHGHEGAFTYVECSSCGLVQLEEIPKNLGDYYKGYRVHGSDTRVYHALRKLTIGHCYLEEPGHGRTMLDFGCGNGWYIREMAERGWRPTGYEPDAQFAHELSERIHLPVISGDAALAQHHDFFDLITLNFAFEHLDEPRRTLELVTQCLRPGGQIYMSVPNIAGREAHMFKDRWFHLDPPRHISFFTKQLLTKVLEETGYSEIETKDLPMPVGLAGSISYRLWNRFHVPTWYALVVPGMLFSSVVRDGNFAITARRTA
jgi:SAM-dependent methyltransferase